MAHPKNIIARGSTVNNFKSFRAWAEIAVCLRYRYRRRLRIVVIGLPLRQNVMRVIGSNNFAS